MQQRHSFEYNEIKSSFNIPGYLQKIETDPMGKKTIETFNSHNKISNIEKRNSNNELLSNHLYTYDSNLNIIKETTSVIYNKTPINEIFLLKQYDSMNRITHLIEPDDKITQYTYTNKGQIKETIKPDGTILYNEYDTLGNPSLLKSSDLSIHYIFTYNKSGELIYSKNVKNQMETFREFDSKNNLISETLENGLSIKYQYDLIGRKTKTLLLDTSSVEYLYNPLYLEKVIRKDANGNIKYSHEYSEYDLAGLCHKQKTINNSYIYQNFDSLGQKINIESTCFSQSIDDIDPCGNIKKITYKTPSKNLSSSFKYDDLEQLIEEDGIFSNKYSFDSLNNRRSKNDDSYVINNLNQVESSENLHIIYDKNGNSIRKDTPDGPIYYKYDALDRLINILKENEYLYTFSYDSMHRRISKLIYTFRYDEYVYDKDYNFLYDDQDEIATCFNNRIYQLRILGYAPEAELGAAIALEIKNQIYLPINDLLGNISMILSQDNIPVEYYLYSAYGEEKIFQNDKISKTSILKNPWRFASKHTDETSLIFYGRRYYDPSIGRWLSPDPSGFTDGLNLYAFVLNNPLAFADLYGLLTADQLYKMGTYKKNNVDFFESKELGIVNEKYFFKSPHESHNFDLGKPEVPNGGYIIFHNGIMTKPDEAKNFANYISDISGGYNVHVTYKSTTENVYNDARKHSLQLNGIPFTESLKLRNNIKEGLSRSKTTPILLFATSGGAISTKLTMLSLTHEEQKRVRIVGISPAGYTKRKHCLSCDYYGSGRDAVYELDLIGRIKCRKNVNLLRSHPNAPIFDHTFVSPTFEKPIRYQINEYIKSI
ncbi:MAG: RHS repeat-associated core domain-containing protein [Candidatus Lokiarchaeota archaeon]|nr:RHS repeat-associated core domain-containing protein [Candidatus Lokiarchaeota archaeon]